LAVTLYLSYAFYLQILPLITIITLVSGVIGTARLILNAHSMGQVYAGFGLGLVCVWAVLYYI